MVRLFAAGGFTEAVAMEYRMEAEAWSKDKKPRQENAMFGTFIKGKLDWEPCRNPGGRALQYDREQWPGRRRHTDLGTGIGFSDRILSEPLLAIL